ncbi:MAG: czcR 3 [Caulobacteraceae bacterium]|nr:czcR 3 [Caulobacteraceae bacterium]
MARILVVEDDFQTAAEVSAALSDHGLDVRCVHNGVDGLVLAIQEGYEAIVLDRMLPGGMDGLSLLAALRSANIETPVLILSALSTVDERVRGLRAGGDDYLTKPFEYLELTARIDALLRRRREPGPSVESQLRVRQLTVDLMTRVVRWGDQPVDLTPREYRLLEYLARRPGEVLTRTMLLEAVWGYRYDERSNLIDVHMNRLRRKLEAAGAPASFIKTVRGAGYVVDAPA